MSLHHRLVQLGMDLGLAVNDYNMQDTESFDDIIKLSLAYVAKVKEGVMEGHIKEEDMMSYLGLMGESWASIQPRLTNEYVSAAPAAPAAAAPAAAAAPPKTKPATAPVAQAIASAFATALATPKPKVAFASPTETKPTVSSLVSLVTPT